MLGKTRRGCDVLRKLGWDAVRHGRRTPWPVTPEEPELQQPQACDPNPLVQAPPTRTRKPLSGSLARTRYYSEGSPPMDLHGKAGYLRVSILVVVTFSVIHSGKVYYYYYC